MILVTFGILFAVNVAYMIYNKISNRKEKKRKIEIAQNKETWEAAMTAHTEHLKEQEKQRKEWEEDQNLREIRMMLNLPIEESKFSDVFA